MFRMAKIGPMSLSFGAPNAGMNRGAEAMRTLNVASRTKPRLCTLRGLLFLLALQSLPWSGCWLVLDAHTTDGGGLDAAGHDAGSPVDVPPVGESDGGSGQPDANWLDAGPRYDGGRTDGGQPIEGTPDAGRLDGGQSGMVTPPPPNGQVVVDTCFGETGVGEQCVLVTDASACTETKCSKLVVIFSGGEMGCVTGTGYSHVLESYAGHGYAAVCINYFESPEGSGSAPYVDEATRIDIALREATAGEWAQAYWTGEDLLLEGISHGATAPVILMARTNLDLQPHWHGSRKTAGCFFDGIYDPVATANLLATGGIGGAPCPLYHRMFERYCGLGATPDTCNLSSQAKVQEDTITQVLPFRFAIRDFQMFECGSALNACLGDTVAGPPIRDLCQRIDGSPNHSCSFGSLPLQSHLTCHANRFDSCRVWFESLTSP